MKSQELVALYEGTQIVPFTPAKDKMLYLILVQELLEIWRYLIVVCSGKLKQTSPDKTL